MPVLCCDLSDKVAIVTGASRGIGKAISIKLAKCGAKIMLVAQNINGLDIVKESITSQGFEAETLSCDVSNTKSFGLSWGIKPSQTLNPDFL